VAAEIGVSPSGIVDDTLQADPIGVEKLAIMPGTPTLRAAGQLLASRESMKADG
jgi:hypothetical protein